MIKANNILGIDWGTKYIGLAYVQGGSNVVLPIGNLINDGSIFFNIGDVMTRYSIKKIVIGYPNKQEDIQKKIDEFINSLGFMIDSEVSIEKQEEDYSSVQAGAVTGDFSKNHTSDTLAAMEILERYIKTL